MANRRDEIQLEDVTEFLRAHCFSIEINMNDTFHWGCADSERVDVHDLDELLRLEKKYGVAGIDAFVIAKRREQEDNPNFWYSDDILPYYATNHLDKVKEALSELASYETYPGMFDKYGKRFCD